MASETVRTPGIPEGTTVGSYPVSRWREDQLPPAGAPLGASVNSQTVANQQVTFTGLTALTDYFATDASGTRYYRFTVDADTTGGTVVPGAGTVGASQMDPALLATMKGFVNHGATAGTARPSGFTSVEWIGSVAPTNAVNGDTWIDTTT